MLAGPVGDLLPLDENDSDTDGFTFRQPRFLIEFDHATANDATKRSVLIRKCHPLQSIATLDNLTAQSPRLAGTARRTLCRSIAGSRTSGAPAGAEYTLGPVHSMVGYRRK